MTDPLPESRFLRGLILTLILLVAGPIRTGNSFPVAGGPSVNQVSVGLFASDLPTELDSDLKFLPLPLDVLFEFGFAGLRESSYESHTTVRPASMLAGLPIQHNACNSPVLRL